MLAHRHDHDIACALGARSSDDQVDQLSLMLRIFSNTSDPGITLGSHANSRLRLGAFGETLEWADRKFPPFCGWVELAADGIALSANKVYFRSDCYASWQTKLSGRRQNRDDA